jgi:hypothetical protein
MLSAEGIDVDSFDTNSLRVHRIDRPYPNKYDAFGSLKRIREESIRGMKHPYRFVGRTITDRIKRWDEIEIGHGKDRPRTF